MQVESLSWFPGHMTKTRRMIAAEIGHMDAVCEILDARIPLASRNPDVDELTAGKPRMVVLNRVDQADPEGTKRWAEHFRAKGYAVLESDAKSGVGTAKFAGAVRELLADKLRAYAEKGMTGRVVRVMILGIPNVGKSTLLSVVSKAQPKIANYHFTTLYPNLGVVWVDEGVSFVMADIPGIIEGASEGAGLGHDFLRHIDRCRLLVHVVDVSGSEGRDPVADFDAINAELEQYSPDLAKRPQIVAANKVDIMTDPENLERLRAHVEAKGFTLMEISAAAHQGTRELVGKVAEALASLPPVTVYEPEYVPKPPVVDTIEPLDIQRLDDGHTWLIQGPWLQRLMANVNFDDYESRMWFDKTLRESGLYQQLEERGIEDGDTVSLDGYEFEYQY